MTLVAIQNAFNNQFDVEALKTEAENGLSKYLQNEEFILNEYSSILPDGFTVDDLYFEYSCVHCLINRAEGNPLFRIRYLIKNKLINTTFFWYEMEFTAEGETSDDYFDRF